MTVSHSASGVNSRGSPTASTADVMLLQEAMQHLGWYDGAIDGIPGAKTIIAVKRYKRCHGLSIDKRLDSDFIEHVRQHS